MSAEPASSPSEGGSTLLVYSRSLVGRKDFGVNRARLRRWLARITEEAGGAGT